MANLLLNSRLTIVKCTPCFTSRSITTRPTVEWTDRKRWGVRVDEEQIPVVETPHSRQHKWMYVRFKNKNAAEGVVHSIATDETRKSNPIDARKVSDEKLRALKNSLMARGSVLPCSTFTTNHFMINFLLQILS